MQGPLANGMRSHHMTQKLAVLFAVAGGIAVGNLYWAQPLVVTIANALSVPIEATGLLVTVTQLGYATGILLLVPLGDMLNRRVLIALIMALSGVALLAASVSPGFGTLLISLTFVGLLTCCGQLLPPLASDLAEPEMRGRVLGTVASGMLTGILLSRTVSGFIADMFGWRSVFVFAAVASMVMAGLLYRLVPSESRRGSASYGALIVSIFQLVREHAAVRVTLIIGSLTFAVFSMFWTGLTFLLTEAPFNYSMTQVGAVGLAGLAGALAARNAGRLHDRGHSVIATGIAQLVTLASLLLVAFGASSIFVIVLAVIFLDAAIQTINVLNQTRLLSIDPSSRSRMNSAFVASNFVGGATGSVLSGAFWPFFGWAGLMCAASILMGVAFMVWLTCRSALDRK